MTDISGTAPGCTRQLPSVRGPGEHRLVPMFTQPKSRTSPGWEYFATLSPQYPWGCLDCDYAVVMTHAAAIERGLARCLSTS